MAPDTFATSKIAVLLDQAKLALQSGQANIADRLSNEALDLPNKLRADFSPVSTASYEKLLICKIYEVACQEIELKRYDQAEALLRSAIKLVKPLNTGQDRSDSKHPSYLLNLCLGRLLFDSGKKTEAAAYARDAANLCPDVYDPGVLMLYGQSSSAIGDSFKASECYESLSSNSGLFPLNVDSKEFVIYYSKLTIEEGVKTTDLSALKLSILCLRYGDLLEDMKPTEALYFYSRALAGAAPAEQSQIQSRIDRINERLANEARHKK